MLFDTHCHVHFHSFKDDMNEVIRRAREKDVMMVTVGTQLDTSRRGLEVAERFDGLWATVGLHPNHLVEQSFWDEDELPPESQPNAKIRTRAETFDYEAYKLLAQHPKCVAIGETGLDFYRIPEQVDRDEMIETQRATFILHAELATELNLPITIHCRDAYKEQADLVEELIRAGKLPKRGVVHCFSGTYEEAKRFVELGFYISFSGVVTFPPRKNDALIDGLTPLQYTARALPIDQIVVETDSPYLTPIPHRGKRNEPAYVKHVAAFVAELRKIPTEEMERVTTQNAKKLFSII